MLVLSRMPGEEITIFLENGERINIKVLNIKNRTYSSEVSVGIEAPQEVTILRNELLDKYPRHLSQPYDVSHD